MEFDTSTQALCLPWLNLLPQPACRCRRFTYRGYTYYTALSLQAFPEGPPHLAPLQNDTVTGMYASVLLT